MNLKSIELQGYKTFAGRTLFDFDGAITCIVGPNGSGKSNIANSIRWVLGEQSYSLLRGKRTVDMIFSGSEQRSRAGMASVSIVFDNQSGWLPIDFSDVSITRRAYRDGQNEYIINGQRVRLRDVAELLGKSGLSERTYTIIGQGLVDAALALKAEERRRLFEEAAGVSLYRSRRREAQRRLETTNRNLERVEDILAELKPRLRSLERQARKAGQFEQVQADLRHLLRDWYGFHWYRAQRKLSEAREIAQDREHKLAITRQEHQSLDQKINNYQDRILSLRAKLSSWLHQSSQLHARRETITRELAVTDERLRSLTAQRRNITTESARLEQLIVLQRTRQAEASQDVEQLEDELTDAQTQAKKAQDNLLSRQADRTQADELLRGYRQQVSELSNQQNRLQAQLSERQTQIDRHQMDLESAVKSVEISEIALQEATKRFNTAAEQYNILIEERQAAEIALENHRQKINENEGVLKQVIEEHADYQTQLVRFEAQLAVIDQAEANLVGYAEGAQRLLKAGQEGRLKGVIGALTSRLNVPEELETAVVAALGENIDTIILDEAVSADEALDILIEGKTRGGFLPLGTLVPKLPLAIDIDRDPGGIIGIASELVKTPPKLRPVVDLLLSQVIVVKTRTAARRALSGQPLTTKAVTLAGEVYHADGPIYAGQEGQSSLLSRQRQRREFSEKIDETKGEISELEKRLEALNQQHSTLMDRNTGLVEALEAAQSDERIATDAHRQAGLHKEQASRQVQWHTERRDVLAEDVSKGVSATQNISEQLIVIDEEITRVRGEQDAQRKTLNALNLDEFQAQVSHWNTQIAVVQQAVANVRNREHELQSTFYETNETLDEMKTRVSELIKEFSDLEIEKESLRSSETEVMEEINSLRTLIDPTEAELNIAEEERERLLSSEAKSRQELNAVERLHNQAQLNLTRRQENLDRMRERVEDDFGLVEFEYAEEVSGPTPLPLGELVEQLPMVNELPEGLDKTIKRQRAQLRRMGAVNPEAQTEFQEVKQRHEFMTEQITDLKQAETDIKEVILELDMLMEREFRKTYEAVATEFREIFTRLFGGGSARLMLTDPDDLTETGIDIEARLPGRRTQGLSLLSGGERSLTATALVFALLRVSPTPFCVLDEVDAMLDEANVGRFRDLLRELSTNTQFIVITHNRNTVQAADVIYGVTMGRDSVSQVISLKLDEVSEVVP